MKIYKNWFFFTTSVSVKISASWTSVHKCQVIFSWRWIDDKLPYQKWIIFSCRIPGERRKLFIYSDSEAVYVINWNLASTKYWETIWVNLQAQRINMSMSHNPTYCNGKDHTHHEKGFLGRDCLWDMWPKPKAKCPSFFWQLLSVILKHRELQKDECIGR